MEVLKPTAGPTTKRVDVAAIKAAAENIDQMRRKCLTQFIEAVRTEPGRPALVLADVQAARQQAGEAFAAAARALNATDLAIQPVNEDAVFVEIDRMLHEQQEHQQLQMPLHKVPDLSAHGLRLVGRSTDGDVWLCTTLALVLSEAGMVAVHLRPADMTDSEWFDGWLARDPYPPPVLRSLDYPLHAVKGLAQVLGFARLVPPTEEQMAYSRVTKGPNGAEGPDPNEPGKGELIAVAVAVASAAAVAGALFYHFITH